MVFIPTLATFTLACVRPLGAMLQRPAETTWGLLAVSAAVLAAVVGLVLLADVIARGAAGLAVRDVDRLVADVHRCATAEERDRRGNSFLDARSEVAEAARLRAAASNLLRACQRRRIADQTVLGGAVHDVKAGLAGLAHLLDAGASSVATASSTGRDVVAASRGEVQRLLALLTTMVAFLRSARNESARTEDVDLGGILRQAVASARRLHPAVEVSVSSSGSPRVQADSTLLGQALFNLVENAARMARTKVSVSVFPGLVRIEDDGPGLPATLEHLGDAFVSVDAVGMAGNKDRASLGLGLYIAQRVLEAHDGGLAVERSDAHGTVLLAYLGRSP